ncbi:hypothetical protein GCM10018790_28190 [Kitasatospora xanthocidica]|uniref:DUF5682 family protein n=1 Tax=Kitasatospora xanthocidica TaxID=83382 RepID=UPI00167192BB|nr:DUF5682 family protein [Kitasatospora xanthocidica]GHF48827.1 hypothetical protein GCM10018790_28190 [Kitasatospora xanthocidica]
MSAGEVALLGIRHHGPGSARAVAAALARWRPDAVLIEGPPEADGIVHLAAEKDLVPPVALLAHAVDDPAKAAFWPYAEFSPEWVAIRHAVAHDLPVRFIDLPAGYGFAPAPDVDVDDAADAAAEDGAGHDGPAAPPADPVALLAEAAGHDDPERWWEDVVEHRAPGTDALAPFAAVAEAMGALRAEGLGESRRDLLREAYMRQQIRAARRAGHERIAVVCGAFHVPALETMPTVAHDRALLAGLPKKVRTDITWVPWTHRRLSQATGYGAGVESPGWYHHLFTTDGDPVPRWLTRAADLLRAEDHPVSSAHVIEAVRLAETLAVMRGRPLAGLTETLDAVRAVLCEGSDVALELVRDRLVVGDQLGEVPDTAPAVPLQRDLARLQRSLRLKPEAAPKEVDLDLRKENDAARSRLLHRLRLLGVDWGVPARSTVTSTGTFRESWRLCWQPEFAVRIAEAAQWGTTVEEAAGNKAVGTARAAVELAELTGLVESCLLAGLSGALPAVMRVLADCAALDTDVAHLAGALPALVRALRYGDVRGTDHGALAEAAAGLAERVCVGLPSACVGLDAEGATAMRARLDEVHGAIGLLTSAAPRAWSPDGPDHRDGPDGQNGQDGPDHQAGQHGQADRDDPYDPDGLTGRWAAALRSLAAREPSGGPATGAPGLLRGRAVRLLLDEGRLDSEEAGRRLRLVLSVASAPADAAGWVEGFLTGGGALLLHDPRLLALLDEWLTGVSGEVFTDVLPLLRRTFAALEAGVRTTIGGRVAAGPLGEPPADLAPAGELDRDRADAAVPVVALLLGVRPRIPRQPAGRDT